MAFNFFSTRFFWIVVMLFADHCKGLTIKFKVVWHYSGLSLTAERETDQTVRQSGISTTQVAIISAAVVLVSAMVLAAYIIHIWNEWEYSETDLRMKGNLLNGKCGWELNPSDGQMLWPLFVSIQLLKHEKELNPFKHKTFYAPLQRLQSHNFWRFQHLQVDL